MAIETTRDLCLSVADAIREKKGSSELINPQDFAKEIASIEGGGSGEGGGSTWRYFDVSGVSDMSSIEIFCMMIKIGDTIIPYSGLSTLMLRTFFEIKDGIKAIGVCPFTLVLASDTQVFDDNMITMFGQQYGLTEITKEQFYDLNA